MHNIHNRQVQTRSGRAASDARWSNILPLWPNLCQYCRIAGDSLNMVACLVLERGGFTAGRMSHSPITPFICAALILMTWHSLLMPPLSVCNSDSRASGVEH